MTDADRIRFDPFDGDRDVDIRAMLVRIVTTLTPHPCASPMGNHHTIAPGTRARYEQAIVDGEWARYWTCVDCVDEWLRWCWGNQ